MSDRIERIASRIKTLGQAARLWDWIDHQDEPEQLWAAMAKAAPWCFADPTKPNSLRTIRGI
jgi:hypothetical protein